MEVLSSRVLYRARHLPTLRHFYEHVLGLHVYREYGPEDDVLGVVFFLGGGFLELTRSSPPSPPVSLWLQVPDVQREEDRLRRAGVEVAKAAEQMPWGLIESWVRDPEGNDLRLVEVPAGHPLRRRL